MAISDEELAKKQARVVELREQVASEEAKRQEREAGLQNDITAAQLDAETARLEAQLQAAKEANRAAESAAAPASAPAKAGNESKEG